MSEEIVTGNSYIDESIGSTSSIPEFRLKFINLLNNENNEKTNQNKDANLKGSSNLENSFAERTNADWQYKMLSEKNKSTIKSNIDGGTEYTNVQDRDTNEWSWSTFGSLIGGAATNLLGVTNTDISNIGSIVSDISAMVDPENAKINKNDKEMSFDERMSKINEWKSKTYKDLHPFDWKPGQTVPQDLMDTSIGSLVSDIVDISGGHNFNRNARKYISPDPVKYVRDSIKSSKGIDPNQEVFKIQSSEALVYKKTDVRNFSGYDKSGEETKFINALKNKNTFNKTLGYIYIKPKYDYANNNGEPMQIPFEFNPEISGDGNQATYVSETLLNRIGQFHVYTGTNLSQLSVSLKYIALSPDYVDEKDIAKQFSTDIWQYYWTNSKIEEIEYKLRSLVFPDVTSANYLIRPPLIELHLGNEEGIENIGDLYKYPIQLDNGNNDSDYLSVTRSVNGSVNRYKKYIVTNVQIEPINEDSYMWPSYYGRVWDNNSKSGSPINHINKKDDGKAFTGTRRTGFRATLQLLEVTENFLDIVPDFRAYYNAWINKASISSKSYDNAALSLGGEIVTDISKELSKSAQSVESDKNDLDELFLKAYNIASLYKDTKDESSSLGKMNNALLGSKSEKDPYYYFNKKWFYIDNKDVKDENLDLKGDPIFFNVLLKGNFDRFIISDDTLPFENGEAQNVYDKEYSNEELVGDSGKPKEGSSISTKSSKDSNKLSKEDFCIGTPQENTDLLGLFENKSATGYDETGKLSYIFQETLNANKYTDAECLLILNRMFDLSDKLAEISSNIKNNNKNKDTEKEIQNIYLDYMNCIKNYSVENKNEPLSWDQDASIVIYIKCDLSNIKIKKENEKNKITTSRINLLNELNKKLGEENYSAFFLDSVDSAQSSEENFLVNEINFIRRMDDIMLSYCEAKLYGSVYDIKTIFESPLILYIKSNKFYDIFLEDYNNAINGKEWEKNGKIKEYFTDNIMEKIKEIRNRYEKETDEYKKLGCMINYMSKIYGRCNNCIRIAMECSKMLSEILYSDYSYKEKLYDVGMYLSKAILCGDNVKCIKSKENNRQLTELVYYKEDKEGSDFNSVTYDGTLKEYIYSTYIKDEGITILNARKIMDAIIESYEDAIKELETIDKKANKLKDKKIIFTEDENLDLKSISFFKDKATYFGNQKDKEKNLETYCITLENDLKNNGESALKFLEYIVNLKEKLYSKNIETEFHKVAGWYKDNGKYPAVNDLNKLSDKYKDYSKNKNSLREEAFKEWDEAKTFSKANELVDTGKFEDAFKDDSNGSIPNKYCTILKRESNMKTLNVASNNIDDYDRLNGESKELDKTKVDTAYFNTSGLEIV